MMDYSHNSNVNRSRKQRSQIPRIKNKAGLLFFRVMIALVLIGGFAAAGLLMGAYMGILRNAPSLNVTDIGQEKYTSIIYNARTGEEVDRLHAEENRVSVGIDQIPENLKNAFVAIEDERFYSHNGVDIRGMGRALYTLVESSGGTTQGASTITQQLIKNKLGKMTNDLISKLQEQYLAIQYEKKLEEVWGSKKAAKDYILGTYMNIINLGRGYYGVQSAAWNYFGKDISELTISECAVIAAITQNPTKYPPDIRPENNRYRQELVLNKMKELEFITEEEYQEAWDDNVYDRVVQGVKTTDGSTVVHSFFTDTLINEVSRDLREKYSITESESYDWIYTRGLQIFSTQDMEMQEIVDGVFLDDSNFPESDFEIDVVYRISLKNSITGKITNHEKKKTVKTVEDVDAFVQSVQDELCTANDDILADEVITTPQPQASFIVIDYRTGQVKALSGGRGEKQVNRSFNRATDAMRSPGSQFKVVASYAPALDLGRITAATPIDDTPYIHNDGQSPAHQFKNWWGSSYEGLSSVRRGIYHSMNILAVKNLVNTGIDTCFSYLQNFGFTTLVEGEWRNNYWFSDKVPSLALGGLTDGVKQVELAAAYGAIANMGEYNKPIFYTKVLDHDGNVILENEPNPRQVLKKATAYVLIDMMKDTIRIGTGGKAAFKEVNMPIAGKTGTSSDTKDLGFSGFTPYYVASVWMGFDQQKKITESSKNHLQIWSKIMEEIHRDLPEVEFERPDGVTSATVCRDSGMLCTDLCHRDPRGDRQVRDLFISGTVPTEYCTVHQELTIDTETNRKANDYCPSWLVETRVGIVRPIPAPEGSIQDRAYELTPEMLEECTAHAAGYVYQDPNASTFEDYYWDDYLGWIPRPQTDTTTQSSSLSQYPWYSPVATEAPYVPSTETPTETPTENQDIVVLPPTVTYETPQPENIYEDMPTEGEGYTGTE